MNSEESTNTFDRVRFFPIFMAATLSAFIDVIGVLLDETVIGNLFGDTAFGAVNLLGPYITTETFLMYLLCVGGGALIVRAHGRHDRDQMDRIFSHCLTSCIMLGLLFFAVFGIFDRPLVDLVAAGTPAYDYTYRAFFWERFTALVAPLYAFLFTYIMYMGGSIFCIVATTSLLGSNLLFSVVLGRMMGISGVTCATFIANVIGVLILLTAFIFPAYRLRFRLYFSGRTALEIFKLGLGESTIFISQIIIEASVNAVSLRLYSIRGLAVAAIIINLYELVAYVSEGISEYETVAINEYIGQGNTDALSASKLLTIRAALIEGVVFGVLFVVLAPFVPELFGIEDPETVRIAVATVRILGLSPVFICLDRILAVFYQYTGRIGRCVATFLLAWGICPAVFVCMLAPISLHFLGVGTVIGPTAALFLMAAYVKYVRKEEMLTLDGTVI
ncbi:Na+-driven multidrug efflux pump [Lachnospiraceae bacterium XBB2008]|nr:Na+-driven multidrug efflux pump [Lachnospiraceae bacterium XBB2008]